MGSLGDVLRRLVPPPVRRFLRSTHRKLVFRSAMRRFASDPTAALTGDSPILRKLVYGWGNEAWSALDEYLAACIEEALECEGPILECGSGLSTLLLGVVAHQRGIRHRALEHTPDWAERVEGMLEAYGLGQTRVVRAPLVSSDGFDWYAVEPDDLPGGITLVICDGPPGTTRGARYGLLPVMQHRLAPACTILLDDVGRQAEQDVLARWTDEFRVQSSILGYWKPFARVVTAPAT